MNDLDRRKYISWAKVRARKAGLTIKFHREGVQPHTTGSVLNVAEPLTEWTEARWRQWYYELLHEVGHEREPWREWKDVMQ